VLYIVIERFRHGPDPVSARAAVEGRMLPHGLRYLDSWVEATTGSRCFQLMETDEPKLLQEWAAHWNDLVEFEFIPVINSAEASADASPAAGSGTAPV
jgi:Protein of unknown function (DUF3303)